jgi:hypothetical protein
MPTREEKNNFSTIVMTRAEKLNTDCMDAMITYCDEIGLEVEVAAGLVNDVLLSKLEQQAQSLGYIERSAKLPI